MALLFATASAALAQGGPPQQEFVEAWYSFLLRWLMEPVVGASLIGFVVSIVITQRWKMTLPIDMPDDQRRRKTQRFSFAIGFLITLVFWPLGWDDELRSYGTRGIYLIFVSGIVCSAMVGALAPFVYSVVMSRLYKMGWFNEVKWSGQARAELKRSSGGNSE